MEQTVAPTANPSAPEMGQIVSDLRERVDKRLDELIPITGKPSEAARHSLLAPGKRLRAILTILAARQCGGSDEGALDTACAVEMVHTASLVFDDLPAMDNADLRRGLPSSHVAFGESVACLGGIGLLNAAFGVVANCPALNSEQISDIVRILSDAIGWNGLVQGQALDLAADSRNSTIDEVHFGKTGVLFVASALAGGATAGLTAEARRQFSSFGVALGHAYQAYDDVLDLVGSDALAGKTTDRDAGKITAISNQASRRDQIKAGMARAESWLEQARTAVSNGEDTTPLAELADYIRFYFQQKLASATRP